ncbi:Uncharacterised protein [uncultured archaeon]|nr:Uncharacterised protein [uncultured archaeon]
MNKPFCEATIDGFICNRRAGHTGDHMDMHESGGKLGWTNKSESEKLQDQLEPLPGVPSYSKIVVG